MNEVKFTTVKRERKSLYLLSSDDVKELHNLLANNIHLINGMDPVEPKGVRDELLLKSAVDRQYVGIGDMLKYDDCFSNCATLVFGLIKNHPFFNGNKRTAFLAMLKHLYCNGYVLNASVRHQVIYDLIVSIAEDSLHDFMMKKYNKNIFSKFIKRNKKKAIKELSVKQKIEIIATWLKRNSTSKYKSKKNKIRLNELRPILAQKGVMMEQRGTEIVLYMKKRGFLFREKKVNVRSYKLGNTLTEVDHTIVNKIRRDYNLQKEDGVDDEMFFDSKNFLDKEIVFYKKLIYKLSKT